MTKKIEWIQGLRAVAVLAVVAYHIDHSLLPGGFLGVDLFFVISGFLITRKLTREVESTGTIDAFAFWGARARRLLPNALLVLLVVLLASFLLLPAYRFSTVSMDVTRAAIFISNYLFDGRATDYFHFNDVPSPVLHFWSLSIEEQYYFGLPIILLAISVLCSKRFAGATNLFLFVALISSLAICIFESQSNPAAAFFHTQSRVWQLALGGIIGINFDKANHIPASARLALAYLGALSFVGAAIFFNNDIGYPGVWAIMPTSASAMVLIGAPAATRLANLLSMKPMTAIGDRSYSLYLWHWPVLAITAERWPESSTIQILAIPVFIGLAYGSFEIVEKPIHNSRALSEWRLPIAAVGIAFACLCAYLLSAFPASVAVAERTQAIKKASSDFSKVYADHCHLNVDETKSPPCKYGVAKGRHTVVLFGDSHSAQWFDALDKAATKAGWRLIARTKTSCPSVNVGIWLKFNKSYYGACDKWRESVFQELRKLRPDVVILANYSHYYGWLYDKETRTILSRSKAEAAWREGYQRTLQEIDKLGIATIVVRDNPELLRSYRDCLAYRTQCGRPRSSALSGMSEGVPKNTSVLDFSERICSGSWCPAEKGGNIIYQDQNHLTASYAVTFWRDFLLAIKSHAVLQTHSDQ